MVGGGGTRGVVAAASYEARQFGVRSAMPGHVARRLCPEGIFVPPRFARYKQVSRTIFSIFQSVTEQIEGLSLDEAFLDVTEIVGTGRSITLVGRQLKQQIGEQTGLSASVGMAHNKLLAKLASDYDKPDGFIHVDPSQVQRFLDPLPIRRLWGIGPRTAMRLHDAGIYTAGQLRQTAADILIELFGPSGPELARRASGIDERPVKPSRVRRSISQETTFDEDLTRIDQLEPVIAEQASKIAERLKDKHLHARTVILKLRSSGFSTLTRSQSLSGYTRDPELIARVAMDLLNSWADWRSGFAVRLIGVGVSSLTSQPDDTTWLGP